VEFDGRYSKSRDRNEACHGKTRSYCVSVGMDMVICDRLLGGAFHYGDSRLKVDALRSRSDIDSISLYGGRKFLFNPGALSATGGYTYGYHKIDGQRYDFPSNRFTSDYNGQSRTAYLDAAFAFNTYSPWTFAPFADVMRNAYRNTSFTERGYGAGDALSVDARIQDNWSTTVGLRTHARIRNAFVDAQICRRRIYGDITSHNSTFMAGSSNGLRINGDSLSRDELVYGVDVGCNITRSVGVRATYDSSTKATVRKQAQLRKAVKP
jgi:uncharacterized protein with beta-barrel porin domain